MKNIILVGFMGTGKTTVGKMLADRIGMTFTDMDDIIEERAGKKISLIFEQDGEPKFREMERAVVEDLSQKDGLVIGAGGGVVLDKRNIDDYSESGLVVCLTATEETILARVSAEDHRPLLEGDEKSVKIGALLKSRQAIYAAISKQIDTTELSPAQVAEAVLAFVEESG